MRFGINLADEVDQRIYADDFDEEIDPFGSPDPHEVVNETADAARTGHRDRVPNAGARDRAHDVKDEQKHAVTLDEFHQFRLFSTVRLRFEQGKEERCTDRRVRGDDVNDADDPHDPSGADTGDVKHRVEA